MDIPVNVPAPPGAGSGDEGAALSLRLLGDVRVTTCGEPVAARIPAKSLGLLAYLALSGKPESRQVLAGMFWGDSDEAAARASLRVALSGLRKAIGAPLVIERESVSLDRSRSWIDVDQVTVALAAARSSPAGSTEREKHLRRVVALYRGELLAGLVIPDAEAFDEQVAVWRQRLHHDAIWALRERLAAGTVSGDAGDTLDTVERLLELEPWDEAAHRRKMTMLAERGQRNAALAQFTALRVLLVNDLGIEPEDETVALANRIRNGGLVAEHRHTRWEHLPIPPTPLVGRDTLLAEIVSMIGGDSPIRLITLVGPGGVGKTRLALEAGIVMRSTFTDGVVFVTAATAQDDAELLEQIARDLRVEIGKSGSVEDQLAHALGTVSLLLVLDNLEQIAGDGAGRVVASLLARCPGLTVLATSRQPLRVRGEHVQQVTPLATPDEFEHVDTTDADTLEGFIRYPAVALFIERASGVDRTIQITPENVRRIAEICGKLDGLPLALELAASWVRVLSLSEIAARLDRPLALLTRGSADLPPRHQGLYETIAWSDRLLSDAERHIFYCLGIVAGGAALETIEAICGGDGADVTVPSVLQNLAALVEKSLVVVDRASGRYRMLTMIREYALMRLRRQAFFTQVRGDYADWCIGITHAASGAFYGPSESAWLAQIDDDYDNLLGALRELLEEPGDADRAVVLVAYLWPYWDIRGLLSEGRRWLDAVLSRAPHTAAENSRVVEPTTAVAMAMLGAGMLAQRQGDYPAAQRWLDTAGDRFRLLGNTLGTAATLAGLARVEIDLGNYDEARRGFEQSLAAARASRSERHVADALAGLGVVAYFQSEHRDTLRLLRQALAIRRASGDGRGAAVLLHRMSETSRHLGELEQARSLAQEALEIQQRIGNRWGIAYGLNSLGNIARDRGDLSVAESLMRRCHVLQLALGDRQGAAYTLHQRGIIARSRGDLMAARELAEASLTTFFELGHRRGIAYVYASLGATLCLSGDLTGAKRYLIDALRIQRELGDRRGLTNAIEELARVRVELGHADPVARMLAVVVAERERMSEQVARTTTQRLRLPIDTLRERLGNERFEREWEQGSALSVEQVAEEILRDDAVMLVSLSGIELDTPTF